MATMIDKEEPEITDIETFLNTPLNILAEQIANGNSN